MSYEASLLYDPTFVGKLIYSKNRVIYKGSVSGMIENALAIVRRKFVVKRDGRKEPFSLDKLVLSVKKAFDREDLPNWIFDEIIDGVVKDLSLQEDEVGSPIISDLIEKHIIIHIIDDARLENVARKYVLARIYNQVYGKGGWSNFDTDDLRLTFNALKVLEARYLLKNPDTLRYTETPKMMFDRVASYIALPEKKYGRYEEFRRKFFDVMRKLLFIPNSPTLMNAGTRNGVLSACYVIPVRDSMATENGDGIMDAVRAMALIQQQGGGTGFNFSELRPEGDVVSSTAGVASGPVSFMRLFDVTTDVIKQGGKRRGANMGILHVWHPDIEKFIKSKTGELKDVVLQNFNISVAVYDEFMRKAEKGEEWPLINPRKTWLHNTKKYDSRYYAISQARHSINEEWVQEQIIKELEQNDWNIPLHESKIITLEEAIAIAENEKAITKTINAQKLLKEITESAWDSGDPGIVFIDEMNRRHPTWYLGKINATNPCVTGDSRILTPEGLVRIKDLYEAYEKERKRPDAIADPNSISAKGSPKAYSTSILLPGQKILLYKTVHGRTLEVNKPVSVRGLVWKVGLKPVKKISTKEGIEIKTTPDHRILTDKGWKKAEDLVPGDKILLPRIDIDQAENYGKTVYKGISLKPELGFILGWIIGDGGIRKYGNQTRIDLYFSFNEENIADYVEEQLRRLFGYNFSITRVSKGKEIWMFVKKRGVWDVFYKLNGGKHEKQTARRVPESVFQANSLFVKSFLRGLFTADGTVDRDGAVRLTSKYKELLKDVQQLLLLYGIKSKLYPRPYKRKFYYTTKRGIKKEYTTQEYYELVISGYSRKLFYQKIGFFGEKQIKLQNKLAKTKIDEPYFTIKSIENLGKQIVYDMTVPSVHAYISQWMVSHNCGEEPLLEWESCNLGSIDVSKFVVEVDGVRSFDWDGLADVVRIAVRFLDNVIDMNRHPLHQLNEANRFTRKIGLGVMGFAHLLAKLGIPYDSPEAVYLGYKLAEWIYYNAVDESIDLAREKGVFPAFLCI
jgi:ribonucleoside-diphosphate reductase alpha chain